MSRNGTIGKAGKPRIQKELVVAVTSRALFDLEKSNNIFEKKGLLAYDRHQLEKENEILRPGVAFPLVKRLSELKMPGTDDFAAEVVLVSKNNPSTGLRAFNSIERHGLDKITRAAFTGGASSTGYLRAFGVDLFLSANEDDVREALKENIPSARIYPRTTADDASQQIRFAFDGDAVIFSDEAEKVFSEKGLQGFRDNEAKKAKVPLGAGPFKSFLEKIHRIQQAFPADKNPIRTALFTARDAPAHRRAVMTLRHWKIMLNEAVFLGGLPKTEFLEKYQPHIFFDDQERYTRPAAGKVSAAHVPYGVKNKGEKPRRKRRAGRI
jgi:5'-nucleotidase